VRHKRILLLALAIGSRLQAQTGSPAPLPVQVSGPHFVALSVANLAESVRWYRDLFALGVLFEAASPDSATHVILLGNAAVRVELVYHRDAQSLAQLAGKPMAPDMVYGPAKIGFYVRDLDATLTSLRARGAKIEGTWLTRPGNIPPTDTLWQRNVLVRDNAGTYVQFFESKPAR